MRGDFTHTLTSNSGVLAHQSTLGQEREMWFTAFPYSQKRGQGNLRRNLEKEYGSTQPSHPSSGLTCHHSLPGCHMFFEGLSPDSPCILYCLHLDSPGIWLSWLKSGQFPLSLVQLKQGWNFPQDSILRK